MVAMAAGLLALVGGFYFLVVNPALHASAGRYTGRYVKGLAALAPDSAAAQQLADSLGILVRWEGPDQAWTTDPDLPEIGAIRGQSRHLMPRRIYYVVAAPQG